MRSLIEIGQLEEKVKILSQTNSNQHQKIISLEKEIKRLSTKPVTEENFDEVNERLEEINQLLFNARSKMSQLQADIL